MQQTFWPQPSFIVLMSEVAIQKLWLGLVDSRTVSLKKLIKLTFFQKGSDVSCPLHSADFINEIEQIMTQRFHAKTEHDCREPHCKYRQNSTGTVRCGRGREWLLWYLIIKWLTNLNYFVPLSVLVAAYQWLVCYLLKESAAKLQQELSNGKVVHDPLNFFRLFKWHTLKVGGGWTLGLVVQFYWPFLCHGTLRLGRG